jgi:methyl-accepting chemotaxis protein
MGVAQVGEAVTNMDQATQQNAALVEEMAAAASSLKSQAQELVQTVAVFNLGQQEHTYRSTAPAPSPRPAPRPNQAVRSATPAKLAFKGAERRDASQPRTGPKSKPDAPKATTAGGDDDWTSF